MANDRPLRERIFELVNGNPPIKAHILFATLGVEYIHLKKEEIHGTLDSMVELGQIVELRYQLLRINGRLYFPPECKFEFNSYHASINNKEAAKK